MHLTIEAREDLDSRHQPNSHHYSLSKKKPYAHCLKNLRMCSLDFPPHIRKPYPQWNGYD